MESLAENLKPPYYTAVINETQGNIRDEKNVAPADEMVTLATRQSGFLGLETAEGKKGERITVSYWKDIDAIEGWINVGDVQINHRFGVGLADTCGIQVDLVEKKDLVERDRGLRGVAAFLVAGFHSLVVGLLP